MFILSIHRSIATATNNNNIIAHRRSYIIFGAVTRHLFFPTELAAVALGVRDTSLNNNDAIQ